MDPSINTQQRAMAARSSNEALLRDDRQGTPRRSMSIPPGGGQMDGTLVHFGTDPDLMPTKPQGSASGFHPGAVLRGGRQIVDLDAVHDNMTRDSNARQREAHRSTSPRFCSHRMERGARGLADGVAHVATPVAATATLMGGATACGAAVMRTAAGNAVESVPYVGPMLRPAAEVLGAMNGAAAGAASGAIMAQSLPDGETLVDLAKAATSLIGEVVEAAGSCKSRAPSRASTTTIENLYVNDPNDLPAERPANNDDHSYDLDVNANSTTANAQDARSRDPMFMPLTPDHD